MCTANLRTTFLGSSQLAPLKYAPLIRWMLLRRLVTYSEGSNVAPPAMCNVWPKPRFTIQEGGVCVAVLKSNSPVLYATPSGFPLVSPEP